MTEQLNETNAVEQVEKTFTQTEMDAYAQRIADQRVTQALQTQQRKTDAKISEAVKLAQMNEQEKYEYELNQRLAELEEREVKLARAENKAAGVEILAEKGIDTSLIDLVLDQDADIMHERINLLVESFNNAVKKGIESRLADTPPVKTTTKPGVITKEQFSKLSLAQKTELFNKDPELFNQLAK